MSAVRFTARARDDLFEIWRHIATQNSEAVADRIYDRIERSCRMLKDHDKLGRSRPEIHPSARSLVIDRWLAIYRLTDEGALIVRILDGARDFSSLDWANGE